MSLLDYNTAAYLKCGFDIEARAIVIPNVINLLKKQEFDSMCLVVTGISGMAIGMPVSYQLKSPCAVVRKEGDSKHSLRSIEGFRGDQFIVLDDFISTGTTIRTILDTVNDDYPDAVCKGILLYDDGPTGEQPDGWDGVVFNTTTQKVSPIIYGMNHKEL